MNITSVELVWSLVSEPSRSTAGNVYVLQQRITYDDGNVEVSEVFAEDNSRIGIIGVKVIE